MTGSARVAGSVLCRRAYVVDHFGNRTQIDGAGYDLQIVGSVLYATERASGVTYAFSVFSAECSEAPRSRGRPPRGN